MELKCKTCEHMVFDEKYGEYKCAVHHIVCRAGSWKIVTCDNWMLKEKKEKKNGT